MSNKTLKTNLITQRGHKCERCENAFWLNQPIPLQLHHIDGDSQNNIATNLQLLCPNCHALTLNYCGRNIKSKTNARYDDKHICELIPLSQSIRQIILTLGMSTGKDNYDRVRSLMSQYNLSLKPRAMTEDELSRAFNQRKLIRPSKKELHEMVWSKSRRSISKELGVSDKAIQKWCDFYGIVTPPRGYWTQSSERQQDIRQKLGVA